MAFPPILGLAAVPQQASALREESMCSGIQEIIKDFLPEVMDVWQVLFRLRESKVSAMNKISATSDSPFTFKREEGRGVFMVCKNKPDFAQIICSHNQARDAKIYHF